MPARRVAQKVKMGREWGNETTGLRSHDASVLEVSIQLKLMSKGKLWRFEI